MQQRSQQSPSQGYRSNPVLGTSQDGLLSRSPSTGNVASSPTPYTRQNSNGLNASQGNMAPGPNASRTNGPPSPITSASLLRTSSNGGVKSPPPGVPRQQVRASTPNSQKIQDLETQLLRLQEDQRMLDMRLMEVSVDAEAALDRVLISSLAYGRAMCKLAAIQSQATSRS